MVGAGKAAAGGVSRFVTPLLMPVSSASNRSVSPYALLSLLIHAPALPQQIGAQVAFW